MDLSSKISACIALIEHPRTGEEERAAARRLLDRLKAKASREGQDVSENSKDWDRYYRLPPVEYGSKYDGFLRSAEITKRIRADIALARKLARMPAKPGEVKVPDPVGDAPASIKFYVKKEDYAGGRSIDITIKGVPAEWWIDKPDAYDPSRTRRVPGPELVALREALHEITWAYNYDGSDGMVDYFHRNFYDHYRADGHGEGDYPRDI